MHSDPNTILNDTINKSGSYRIYVDVSISKNARSVGSACICEDLNVTTLKSNSKFMSIFTAECIAINDALNIALLHLNRSVNICSDSLSALLSLKKPQISIKTNPYQFEIRKKSSASQKTVQTIVQLHFTGSPRTLESEVMKWQIGQRKKHQTCRQ